MERAVVSPRAPGCQVGCDEVSPLYRNLLGDGNMVLALDDGSSRLNDASGYQAVRWERR